jgi:PAS domain S-box-containing protein
LPENHRFRHRAALTLRGHLLILILATLLPMIVFVIVAAVLLAQREKSTFQRSAQERTLAVLTAVDAELSSSRSVLGALGASLNLDFDDLRAFHADATRVLASQPDWLSVILALPSARQVVNILLPFGRRLPETVERQSFDDAVRTGQPKVGYLSRGTISGVYAFPIRVPVARDGGLKYILSAVVKPRAISELLGAQRLPPDWVGVVLDGDARIVARTLNPELSVGQLASESLRAELVHSPRGWFHGRTREGMSVYTAYQRSASSNWSVAVGIPAAVVEAGARQTAGAMALGVLSAGMLAVGIAVTFGRRISKPIKLLATAAKPLGRGERAEVPRPSGIEEIDMLSRMLDDASATLRNYLTELRLAEERFRQIFEAASAMVMVSEHGRIVLVSAQVEAIFGYERTELVGQPIAMLIPERFRAKHSTDLKQFASDPRTRAMGVGQELFGRRKDGSEVPVEIGLNPIRTKEGLFVVASVIDISERQKTEGETQKLRQELAHVSRVATIGELTAAIVHEIGQPLTAILTNARAGLRGIAAGTTDVKEVRDILEDIVADDHRANQVIQHLRSMFRREAVEHSPIELNHVINEVVPVILRDAEFRRVAVVLDLAPGMLWVSGNRIQLQQVILNLALNAFDAMANVIDRPRRLILRTRRLNETHMQIDVADNGPGIAPEKLGAIFEPFFTSKAGGMGVGLAVSRSIIVDHEGRLWAENGPEGGAMFHIVLPEIAATSGSVRSPDP